MKNGENWYILSDSRQPITLEKLFVSTKAEGNWRSRPTWNKMEINKCRKWKLQNLENTQTHSTNLVELYRNSQREITRKFVDVKMPNIKVERNQSNRRIKSFLNYAFRCLRRISPFCLTNEMNLRRAWCGVDSQYSFYVRKIECNVCQCTITSTCTVSLAMCRCLAATPLRNSRKFGPWSGHRSVSRRCHWKFTEVNTTKQ